MNITDLLLDCVNEKFPVDDPANSEINKILKTYLYLADGSYILVHWPYVQDYMDDEWFNEEAVLTENSSYFVPIKRVYEAARED